MEIADEFYTKPDIYYDINQTNVKMFGFTTHNLIGVNGFGELLSKLQEKEYNLLINDVLTTSIDYMIAIKRLYLMLRLLTLKMMEKEYIRQI